VYASMHVAQREREREREQMCMFVRMRGEHVSDRTNHKQRGADSAIMESNALSDD
jgi:hypothetical protein